VSGDEHAASNASPWVVRFASLIPRTGPVLDVASGAGRHTRWFLDQGTTWSLSIETSLVSMTSGNTIDSRWSRWTSRAVSRSCSASDGSQGWWSRTTSTGASWISWSRRLVPQVRCSTRRSRFETSALGDRHGRSSFFDREQLDVVRGRLRVVAFEDLVVDDPRPAAVQRIAAVRDSENAR
jgi:hypothetical protein